VAVFGLVCVAATSAHWLKNIVFYGDPLYPLLHSVMPSHPFHEGAAELLKREYPHPLFSTHGPLSLRLREALKAVFTHSFVANDFPQFHGARPVFGSLFTLLLPVLVFARAPRRLWWLAGGTLIGVFVWHWTSHADRFLQALVPWMAAAAAACMVLAWRELRWGRVALAALVLFQVVEGGDVYFIRMHGMIGDSPLRSVVEHLSAGHAGRYPERFRIWGGLPDVGKTLPRGSRVLMHDYGEQLGLGVPGIMDHPGWQGGVEYLELDSPARTVALWRKLGATHLVWHAQRAPMSHEDWAREAVYARTAHLFGTGIQMIGGWEVTKLSSASALAVSASAQPTRIAWLGCGGDPGPGIFSPRGLAARRPDVVLDETSLTSNPATALAGANAVLVRVGCGVRENVISELGRSFQRATSSSDVTLYVR
jgi:hypothetical protein